MTDWERRLVISRLGAVPGEIQVLVDEPRELAGCLERDEPPSWAKGKTPED